MRAWFYVMIYDWHDMCMLSCFAIDCIMCWCDQLAMLDVGMCRVIRGSGECYSRRLGIINQVNASLAERSTVPRECAIDRAHLRRGIVFGT